MKVGRLSMVWLLLVVAGSASGGLWDAIKENVTVPIGRAVDNTVGTDFAPEHGCSSYDPTCSGTKANNAAKECIAAGLVAGTEGYAACVAAKMAN